MNLTQMINFLKDQNHIFMYPHSFIVWLFENQAVDFT